MVPVHQLYQLYASCFTYSQMALVHLQLFERADGILFVTDSRSSLTTADQEAADWLRRNLNNTAMPPAQSDGTPPDTNQLRPQRSSIPVAVVANKCDNIGNSALVASAYEAATLGLGDPVLYSAETQAGTADLYDALKHLLEAAEARNLEISGADLAPCSLVMR